MFSVEWLDEEDQQGNAMGNITYDDKRVCFIGDWALNSCAAHALMRWNRSITFPVSEFWDFVSKIHKNWNPQEAYFLLSSNQLELSQLKELTQDERVKEVDSFVNKAHGPCHVHLFRFSQNKDFK